MLDPSKIRSGLNRGRYLFFNPILRAVVGAIDSFASPFTSSQRSLAGIEPEHILVCLQAHIGDVVVGTCVLPVLRAAFPNARIGFLTHPGSVVAIEHHPAVGRVHAFEHWRLNRRGVSLIRKLVDHFRSRALAIREIRAAKYDLAIDCYAYFPNSALLLAAAGIPARLGWTSGGFGAWFTNTVDWDLAEQHVVEWHKRLLSAIDRCRSHLSAAVPMLYAPDVERKMWAETLDREGVAGDYLAFHVGAGSARRRWADTAWLELAKACDELGLHIVLLGHGHSDESLCAQIASLNPRTTNLAGRLSWQLMSVAISQARLVVALDSMSAHVAATWRVPTVCVAPGINGPTWRPYGALSRVVISSTPCSPCFVPDGCAGMECLRTTSARRVFDEVVQLLHDSAQSTPVSTRLSQANAHRRS